MKIRFIKNVLVIVEKPKLQEDWNRYIRKWTEIKIEAITWDNQKADI